MIYMDMLFLFFSKAPLLIIRNIAPHEKNPRKRQTLV